MPSQARKDFAAGRRVQGGEALVEDQEVGILEEGAGEADAGGLALGELPAGFADALLEAGGEAGERALRTGLRVLGEGQLLGIYPEGTRSPEFDAPRVGSGTTRESGMA